MNVVNEDRNEPRDLSGRGLSEVAIVLGELSRQYPLLAPKSTASPSDQSSMKRSVVGVILILLLAGCAGLPADPIPTTTSPSTTTAGPTETAESTVTVTVVEVVDGDTIDIRYANGTTDTVRLLGVDTPEVYGETSPEEFEGVPDTESGEACLRDAGEEASAYAKQNLQGEEVVLVFDSLSDRRGSFGRLLAYVREDGENFNYRLVAEGYARVYDSAFTESDRFYDAETQAQASGIGVWGCAEDTDFTTTTSESGDISDSTGIDVVEIHADAAGDDHENLNDEYLVLANVGNETLDLGGWTVEDDGGHSYTIPADVTVQPDGQITLYSGTGSDTNSSLYWGADSAIWNNAGDTIYVYDESGNLRLERSY